MGTLNKNILVIILFSLSCSVTAQMKYRLSKNDIERFELKGYVKSIFYREFQPSFKNRKKTKYILHPYTFLSEDNYRLNFKKNGYLKEKNNFTIENNQLKKFADWSYDYDNENRVFKEICTFFDSNKELKWEYNYKKDTVEIVKFSNSEPNLFYRYVQENNTEIYTIRNSDNSYKEKTIFEYDNTNRLISIKKNYDRDAIQEVIYTKYIDDHNARKESEIVEDIQQEKKHISKFIYNEKGDASNTFVIINGKKNLFLTFEYIYDTNGNWIERRTYNKDKKLVSVTKRGIEYY